MVELKNLAIIFIPLVVILCFNVFVYTNSDKTYIFYVWFFAMIALWYGYIKLLNSGNEQL